MKTVFKIWLALCLALAPTFSYGDAVIFSGTDVKALKQNLDLFGVTKIMSGTVDPTSSATSAPIGSLYLNSSNGNTYRKLDAGSSTNWTVVGTGGEAGTNYIRNGNALVNTTGWSTYADAAGAVPVDCTGGSPSTTFTRSTTSPLDVANSPGSFLYTHPASNAQGEGVAYPFTISDSDKAKVISIEFDQLVNSGTFVAGTSTADSDVTVYIYDVTNAALIYPSTTRIYSNSTTLTERFKSTFQTPSNSNSYRLCLHNATTAASAFALKLGRIKVAPTTYVYGTPVTDWVAYTPVFVGFGTPTGVSFYSRRVGDSLEVRGTFLSGTTTAVAQQIGIGYAGGSGNVVVDTTKSGTTQVMGIAGGSPSSTTLFGFAVLSPPSNQPYVAMGVQTSTTSLTAAPNASSVASVGQGFQLWFKVPIVGWSSSVQMSTDTDTRVVAARITGLNGVTATTTGGVIKYFTTHFDTHGAYSASTGLYTCPVSGIYRITNGMNNSSAANSGAYTYVGKNGNTEAARLTVASILSGSYSGSALLQCNAGETLGIYSSVNTLALADGASFAYVNYERLTGPSAIAASEDVNVVATSTSTTAIPALASSVAYVFTTEEVDTHGAFTPATGTFTAPVSGKYRVAVQLATISSTVNSYFVQAKKNGTQIALAVGVRMAAVSSYVAPQLNRTVLLNAGDTLQFFIGADGAGQNLSGGAELQFLSIEKVGN